MKNKIIAAMAFLLAFSMLTAGVLATGSSCIECGECEDISGMTIIKGKIYEGELSEGVGRASVSVTCYHNGSEYTKGTLSWRNGKYMIFFFESQCNYGDSITVNAEKKGLAGTNNGMVNMTSGNKCFDLDVGVVNVPLIPEFGIVLGTLTAVSAIGIFLFVRKKS